MVTMGAALVLLELANKFDGSPAAPTACRGVVMGPLLGRFEFDLGARRPAWYSLTVLLVAVLLARPHRAFALGATLAEAVRDNRLRLSAMGIRCQFAAWRRSTPWRRWPARRGPAGADHRLRRRWTCSRFHRSADVMLALVIGGAGWLWGAGRRGRLQAADLLSSGSPPQYWTFWIGLFLVVLMLVGRERLFRPWTWPEGGRHEPWCCSQTGLVKRFGGITATNNVMSRCRWARAPRRSAPTAPARPR